VLLVGLLLAVALSGPVESFHRRKILRVVASVAIILSIVAIFCLGGYLFVLVLTEQIWQLMSTLPFAFSQFGAWAERIGDRTGLPFGDGEGP
jgi:predicted PurR-regulated permease PerM